jgi:CubicO group peptidase (beta-lactamase class C family)
MDNEAILKDINEQVVCAMDRLHIPGVAIGILHQGQEHTAGFGVTHIKNPLPVNTDTLFQAGSIMKTVTGTAAIRLVEMGKLDLDTPISTYLPGLRFASEVVAAQLTIRHLLTHTGAWSALPSTM